MTLRPYLRFAACTLAQLLSILVFSRLQLIPGHLDFNPGIVLTPLAGVLFGPAGIWSAPAASLAADRFLGTPGLTSLFQAVGSLCCAGTARLVWRTASKSGASRGRAVYFGLVCIPAGLAAAAWRALGSEMQGLYPYAYIVSILAAHHAAFCTLLGPPLFMAVSGFETPGRSRTPLLRAGLAAGSAVAAVLIGLGVSRRVYGMGPFEPSFLGTRAGPRVTAAVIPLLLLHLGALAGVDRRIARWRKR